MSLKKQALSGVKWTFLQQVGTQGIGFVISIVLARMLAPEEFGLIGMIAVFMGIGSSLMNAGLGSSLIRSKDLDERDYATVFYFNLVASVFIYLFIYFLAPFIASFYNQAVLSQLIRWYAITFIINAFGVVQLTRLTKLLDFKTQALVAVPSLILGGGVGVFMAYNAYGVWSLIGFYLTQSLVKVIQLWIYSGWKPLWVFDIEKFKKHVHFGYKITLSGLLDTVFNNAYSIVIGKFFPVAQVGFYQRANSLQMYPVGIVSAILSKVTYPLFAQIQDDDVRLKSIYKRILQLNIFLLAPTLIIGGVLAEHLFRFLFTEKWLPAVPYFQILLVAGLLFPIHAFNLNILTVKGRSDLFLRLEIIKKTLVSLTIFIAIRYGVTGLLYGSVFVSILAFMINTHYSGKFIAYGAWEQLKDIVLILGIALITGLLVYITMLLTEEVVTNDFLILVINSLIGFIFYVSLSYLLKIAPQQEILTIIKGK